MLQHFWPRASSRAVYLAIKHFRHFVEWWTFYILTDHKPLTFALSTNSGMQNAAADALSRIGLNSLNGTTIGDLGEIVKAQIEDTELDNLRSSPSLVLKYIPLSLSESTITQQLIIRLPMALWNASIDSWRPHWSHNQTLLTGVTRYPWLLVHYWKKTSNAVLLNLCMVPLYVDQASFSITHEVTRQQNQPLMS